MERAFVMINCEPGSEDSIIDQLQPTKDIKEVYGVYGHYDIIIKLECTSPQCMQEIITKQIRKMEGIRCTTTVICH